MVLSHHLRALATAAAAAAVTLSPLVVVGAGSLSTAHGATPSGEPAPGSLIYVKAHNIYLSRPDGSGERRLTTSGTEASPWVSPSGDDLGNIVAARGSTIYRLDRTGAVLNSYDPPDVFDVWGHQYGGQIVRAAVSPDGAKVAHTYRDFHCVFSDCADYTATAVRNVDGSGPGLEGTISGNDHPSWIGENRLVGNGFAAEGIRFAGLDGTTWDWFRTGGPGAWTALTEPVVSADRTLLATTTDSGAGSHITTYEIDGNVASGDDLPAANPLCATEAADGTASPAFAPDASALAWTRPDGIWIKSDPRDCTSPSRLVVSGAEQVVWSSVALPAAPRAALVLKKAPRITGKARSGRRLSVSKGLWSVAPRTFTYRWLRNGKPIAKATRPSYRITRKDRRKKISVRVIASRPDYLSKTWTSRAVRVRR